MARYFACEGSGAVVPLNGSDLDKGTVTCRVCGKELKRRGYYTNTAEEATVPRHKAREED